MRPWARVTLRLGGWAVLFAVVGLLVATVAVPRVVGGHAYTVTSGSMRPTFEPGSVVVVRPVEADNIDVGSVITFQIEPGKPGVATHRVVTQGLLDGDQPLFHTQGDANVAGDSHWVRPVQVKGEVWYSVPYVGWLTNLLSEKIKHLAVAGTSVVLLGYAALMFLSAIRDRRRISHA